MRNFLVSQLIAILHSRNILTNYAEKETKSYMSLCDVLNKQALRKDAHYLKTGSHLRKKKLYLLQL